MPLAFSSDTIIALFHANHHRISGSIALTRNIMEPLTFVLDRGGGPSLIDMNSLCLTWQQDIEPSPMPKLRAADGQPVYILGFLALFVLFSDVLVKVTFAVVDLLVAGALLGTSFRIMFLKGIFLTATLVRPVNSRVISSLSQDTFAPHKPAVTLHDHPPAHLFVRVVCEVLVQPWTETPALVRCPVHDLIRLQSCGL